MFGFCSGLLVESRGFLLATKMAGGFLFRGWVFIGVPRWSVNGKIMIVGGPSGHQVCDRDVGEVGQRSEERRVGKEC